MASRDEKGKPKMLIVITGPSGCGKSTLADFVLKNLEGLSFSVSYTTRKKRDNEIEGKDYHFVSPVVFETMIQDDRFVEWARVHGNYYGTARNVLERGEAVGDLLLDIDVQGAAQIREKVGDAVFVFIMPPLFPELRRRLERRGHDSDLSIRKRLDVAKEEIKHYREFEYVVINDDLAKAKEELKAVILSQRYRREAREDDVVPILQSFADGD